MTKRKLINKLAASGLSILLIASGLYHKQKKEMFSGKFITGLFFHNPSKKRFERGILWLKKNNCQFISTEQLINIIKSKEEVKPGMVWITFDDGWQKNISEVAPILTKYNIPATFFISTGPVEGNGTFWFSLVRIFRSKLPLPFRHDVKQLWHIEENQRKEIVSNLEQELTSKQFSFEHDREAMTVADIKKLSENPLITFGSHTVNHVMSPNCTKEQIRSEIYNSKLKLESWTGKKVYCYSYPNGDFDGRELKILTELGFRLAATTHKEFIDPSSNLNLLQVPRFCVNDDSFFPEALCQMVGIWGKYMDKLKRKRKTTMMTKNNGLNGSI